ncbi:hypothetical protein [Histidinibacterium aquaticum]|uniref:Uncharacterized protein n=1 Tax=Histidinibacterium aquaticum TaxID=2613962 RepID=A0A5J5GFK8_9RHOB|nr:hypothetical protein [Histidinibacterium aquaticum]KAA9007009.1 hypothetical protein F3S47_14690 [Histidinibacterium aquaticum]
MDTAVTLSLDPALLRAARDVADAREITIQQLLKDALTSELARAHRRARSPVRADERLLDLMRAKFSRDFAEARDWPDLMRRCRAKGVVLREAGGGLALFAAQNGARLCKASDVGARLNRLARRFRAPFPGEALGRFDYRARTTDPGDVEVLDDSDRAGLSPS